MVSFDEADSSFLYRAANASANCSGRESVERVDLDDFDDSGLFKTGASFDINDEGSCLKELNQRLRIADENSERAARNKLTKQKKFDENCHSFNNQVRC